MERIKPPKQYNGEYKPWTAPTAKNVRRQASRIAHLMAECEKVRQRFVDSPELVALYLKTEGTIPFAFAPRPRVSKPRLVVDNAKSKAASLRRVRVV